MEKRWSDMNPPPLSLPSLRIIRHTCDCRGISNVGVLLTLTYITCAVWGGSFFLCQTEPVDSQGLVWNIVCLFFYTLLQECFDFCYWFPAHPFPRIASNGV